MQNLNEVSARYTELPNEFYIPNEWRAQDNKNKQGSIITEENWNPTLETYKPNGYLDGYKPVTDIVREHCNRSYELYQDMIEAGISREMARMVLPVNIYTEIYACWDLKNLLHFITLRDDSHAQSESQEYAKAIKQICCELFPWTMEAYEKYKFQLIEK